MIFTYCPSFPRVSAYFGIQNTATYSHKHTGHLINQTRCHMHMNRCIFLSVHLFIGSNPLQHTAPAYYMYPRNRALNFWALSPCALWSYISAVFCIFILLSGLRPLCLGCLCIPLCPCYWSSMALEARHPIIAQAPARGKKDRAREPCTSTTCNHPKVAQSKLAYQATALLCRQKQGTSSLM